MGYFGKEQNPSKWGIYVCVIIYMCIIHIQTEGNFLEYSIQFLIFYFFFDNFVHVYNISWSYPSPKYSALGQCCPLECWLTLLITCQVLGRRIHEFKGWVPSRRQHFTAPPSSTHWSVLWGWDRYSCLNLGLSPQHAFSVVDQLCLTLTAAHCKEKFLTKPGGSTEHRHWKDSLTCS